MEVHAENFLRPSPSLYNVRRLQCHHEFSVHAVGLSLGSAAIDEEHLERVAGLVDELQPGLVSEHLSWSRLGNAYFNDLLPLPYTEEALDVVARNVGRMQDRLRRQVAIENPSRYLEFNTSTLTEAEFLDELVRRSGCSLLVDINNIVVSAHNIGLDPAEWLNELPEEAIVEYHLAGHALNEADGEVVFIDDHGSRVSEAVWLLFDDVLSRFGARPTLIEWDTDIPPLNVLLGEAERARRALARAEMSHAALAA
ncbi:hypothetical protein RSO01_25060 [Reyranella soli]|uniref:Uncharacterized protein n=1 Tax=Reyranella soli TaxID=1230389 RepID=A0A512N8L7_9HYPH|nr:hypothetical protein RSO01_25060 [Reyranella soli]